MKHKHFEDPVAAKVVVVEEAMMKTRRKVETEIYPLILRVFRSKLNISKQI